MPDEKEAAEAVKAEPQPAAAAAPPPSPQPAPPSKPEQVATIAQWAAELRVPSAQLNHLAHVHELEREEMVTEKRFRELHAATLKARI